MLSEVPGPERVRPVADEITRAYWEATAREELVIQRCRSCSAFVHPPRRACPCCQSVHLGFERVSGRGTIVARTILVSDVVPGFTSALPLPVLAVGIEEDPEVILISNLAGAAATADISIGQAVRVVFERLANGVVLPQFAIEDDR